MSQKKIVEKLSDKCIEQLQEEICLGLKNWQRLSLKERTDLFDKPFQELARQSSSATGLCINLIHTALVTNPAQASLRALACKMAICLIPYIDCADAKDIFRRVRFDDLNLGNDPLNNRASIIQAMGQFRRKAFDLFDPSENRAFETQFERLSRTASSSRELSEYDNYQLKCALNARAVVFGFTKSKPEQSLVPTKETDDAFGKDDIPEGQRRGRSSSGFVIRRQTQSPP